MHSCSGSCNLLIIHKAFWNEFIRYSHYRELCPVQSFHIIWNFSTFIRICHSAEVPFIFYCRTIFLPVVCEWFKVIATRSCQNRLVLLPISIFIFLIFCPSTLCLHLLTLRCLLYIVRRFSRHSGKTSNNSLIDVHRDRIKFVSNNRMGTKTSNLASIAKRHCHSPRLINLHLTPVNVSTRSRGIRTDTL